MKGKTEKQRVCSDTSEFSALQQLPHVLTRGTIESLLQFCAVAERLQDTEGHWKGRCRAVLHSMLPLDEKGWNKEDTLV